MSQITLDAVEKIEVQENEFLNELSTLKYLRYGLFQLTLQVLRQEEVIRKQKSERRDKLNFLGIILESAKRRR